jgi:hypothetical protein
MLLSSLKSCVLNLLIISSLLLSKKLKLAKRHLERVWSKSNFNEDLKLLSIASNHYHIAIIKAKRVYNYTLIAVVGCRNETFRLRFSFNIM